MFSVWLLQSISIGSGLIATAWSTKTHHHVAEGARPQRGILDTSEVTDLEGLESSQLPIEVAVTAITMAELAAGPHATHDPAEPSRRQDRLQRAEAAFDPLPFDSEAARAYGASAPPLSQLDAKPERPGRWTSSSPL